MEKCLAPSRSITNRASGQQKVDNISTYAGLSTEFLSDQLAVFKALSPHTFCGCHGVTKLFSKCLLFGGVVGSTASLAHGDLKSNLLAGLTTPAAPDKEASRLFVDVASTPHKELDVMRVFPRVSSPFVSPAIVVFGNVVVHCAFQVSQRRFRHKAAESSRGDKKSEPVCEQYS